MARNIAHISGIVIENPIEYNLYNNCGVSSDCIWILLSAYYARARSVFLIDDLLFGRTEAGAYE